jgi:hypothetical protein
MLQIRKLKSIIILLPLFRGTNLHNSSHFLLRSAVLYSNWIFKSQFFILSPLFSRKSSCYPVLEGERKRTRWGRQDRMSWEKILPFFLERAGGMMRFPLRFGFSLFLVHYLRNNYRVCLCSSQRVFRANWQTAINTRLALIRYSFAELFKSRSVFNAPK